MLLEALSAGTHFCYCNAWFSSRYL